jgi:hypothetical protein
MGSSYTFSYKITYINIRSFETKIADRLLKKLKKSFNDSPKENQRRFSQNITKTSSPKKNKHKNPIYSKL